MRRIDNKGQADYDSDDGPECIECGVPIGETEGAEDGLCPDCFEEAWGPPRCNACSGSGEGMYDGTRCHCCGGSGVRTNRGED